MFPVEAGNRQPDDFVSGIRNPLHFHASFGSYKKDFGIRTQLHDGVRDGYRRKDMSSCAATTDNDPEIGSAITQWRSRVMIVFALVHTHYILYRFIFNLGKIGRAHV